MLLTLQETKLHLRVDTDFDDALILSLMDTATVATADYLNLTTALDNTAAAPIKSAALLLVADLYEYREISYDTKRITVSATYERLLNPYRAMSL